MQDGASREGKPSISVRPFRDRDAQPLADLMVEMVRFYGATIDSKLMVAEDILRQSKSIDIIVAEGPDGIVGFATFTALYPVSGLISFTYIQQIYVGMEARRMGVAHRLMAVVARTAKGRGSRRVEWSTGRENTAARALYEGLGAVGSDKVQYALEGEALDLLARNLD